MTTGEEWMTIEQYIEMRKKELDRFHSFWEIGQEKDQGIFPKELPIGEWQEQENCYVDDQP